MTYRIPDSLVAEENAKRAAALEDDHASLGRQFARRGLDIESIAARVADFAVAVPTWGVGTGARASPAFPAPASRATSSTSSRTARRFIS